MPGAGAILLLWQLLRSWLSTWSASRGVSLPAWAHSDPLIWLGECVLFTLEFYVLARLVAIPRYRRRYFWVGAVSFGLLCQAARTGLQLYLDRLWHSQELYGGLAAGFGLLMWLFVSAYVLLMSCALVRSLASTGTLEPDTTATYS